MSAAVRATDCNRRASRLKLLVAMLISAVAPVFGIVFVEPPAVADNGAQVAIANYAFSPDSTTVHVGDTVVWTNQDEAPHDATTTGGPASFASPTLEQGESWSYTFTTAGTYLYYCSLHPDMRGRVVVEPEPATQSQEEPERNPEPRQAAAQHAEAPRRSMSGPTPAGTMRPHRAPPVPPARTRTSAESRSQRTPAALPATSPAASDPAAATSTSGLNPLLLLTGLVTAVAVFCLLLVGSRSARRRPGS
jgi:plastocyanin